MTAVKTSFPIDLSAIKPLKLDPAQAELTDDQLAQLKSNVQLCRDAIVFFTAVADAKGLGGHTGGPYDIVPEVLIADGFMKGSDSDAFVPIYFDEAGHRVAIQYLMSVLNGEMDAERLLHYREFDQHLPGHPERDFTEGVKFSSGRLGHMWPYVNGVAMANAGKTVFLFGSDGSQQEGNDAEAARLAVAQNLNVKLLIDDNDVTIAGYPSDYMQGFTVAKTLTGHGLSVNDGDGEDLADLYKRMAAAVNNDGPIALINKRKMCVGIEGLEGSNHGHDVIKKDMAITYLVQRGHTDAVEFLEIVEKTPSGPTYKGSSGKGKNRDLFGRVINEILDGMSDDERVRTVRVFDSDLEGSCGLNHIRAAHPEVFISGGIMERSNYSAAAGFGYDADRQGIFATFSAFLEMVVSEITMARLNKSNVLAHFSHAGCDDMADNTCHFGINNMFAANGLSDGGRDTTRLYFPADQHQFGACVKRIYSEKGLRFIFSTRSAVPDILNENGDLFYGDGYEFTGKDEVIRDTEAGGFIVSFGESLYRALDAVETLRADGVDAGLVNKATLNVYDEDMMAKLASAPFVLVSESFNVNTGVGSRFGTELLKRGFTGRYNNIGTNKEGSGGLWRQMVYQGLDSQGIADQVRALS